MIVNDYGGIGGEFINVVEWMELMNEWYVNGWMDGKIDEWMREK